MTRAIVGIALALLLRDAPLQGQTARFWQAGDRTLITSFDDIAALTVSSRLLFAATPSGLSVYDVTLAAWQAPLAPLEAWPAEERPSAVAWDGFGDRLWLGTEAGRLHHLVLGDDRWERPGFSVGEPILRIVPDSREGTLWVGTPSGWYRVRDDGSSGRFVLRELEVPAEVRREGEQDPVLRAVEGSLGLDDRLRRFPVSAAVTPPDRPVDRFVGTHGGGLLRFDATTLSTEWLPFGTLSRGIASLAVDGDRIWFGGDGQGPRDGVGVAGADLARWQRLEAGIDGAPRGFVARITIAADAVWFAASDGVYRLPRTALASDGAVRSGWQHLTTVDGLPADQATIVVPVPTGAWIGTLRGLVRVDTAGRATESHLPGRRVLDLAHSGEDLWIATDQGLFRTMATGGGAPTRVEDAPLGVIVAVVATSAGVAVLTPAALYRRGPNGWTGPDREPAARLGGLLRLIAHGDGSLWVAGEQGVGMREETGSWRWWLAPSDIPAAPVRGLVVTDEHLWVATPAGALRLDRSR
jgi:hypothetical protein